MNYWQTIEKFLVDNYKDAPKWLSMWALVLIGCAPELYDLAVQYHLVDGGAAIPPIVAKLLNTIGFLGAAGRLLNQAAVAKGLKSLVIGKPDDPSDEAGA